MSFIRNVCVILMVLAGAARGGEDWPQFRGPTGQGISTATSIPVEWDTSKNVAWKVPVPGRGWSSPIVVGSRIYVTTATGDGAGTSLRAMCLELSDGKPVWDTEVFRPDAAQVAVMHQKNSPASSTPLIAGDRLYAHFGHLGTAALDLDGNVIWRQNSIKYPAVHGNGGSPVLVDGMLIFNCDGSSNPFIAALEAKSGDVKWKTPRDIKVRSRFSFSTPLAVKVNGSMQVISPGSGMVGSYDPRTGRELWRVRYGQGYSVVPRPARAENGLVLVSSGYDSAVMYAIRPDGARGDATSSHVAWKSTKGAPNTPSPLPVGDELYLVADNGMASCLDTRSGKVHWNERLEGNFSASPVFADGRVYYQNEEGVGFVVKAGKTFELLAENDLGERSLASYAVADGALLIRTEKHLWKIAAR